MERVNCQWICQQKGSSTFWSLHQASRVETSTPTLLARALAALQTLRFWHEKLNHFYFDISMCHEVLIPLTPQSNVKLINVSRLFSFCLHTLSGFGGFLLFFWFLSTDYNIIVLGLDVLLFKIKLVPSSWPSLGHIS